MLKCLSVREFWTCRHFGKLFLGCIFCLFFFPQYLSKQNIALREVNDSRVKIYEQLEESISDMENANKKLVEESVADKSKIKR